MAAYYVPILSAGSEGEQSASHRHTVSSPDEITSLLHTICQVAITCKTLDTARFDQLMATLSEADAATAEYLKTKMESIIQSKSASTSG